MTTANTMPEKAAIRLAELGTDLLTALEREVSAGRPIDAFLANAFRQNRHFGSRDRRFFMQLAFSYFRWRGWIGPGVIANPSISAIAGYLLDAEKDHPAIAVLARDCGMPATELQPLGPMSLNEKSEALKAILDLDAAPSSVDLVPEWTADMLLPQEGTEQSAGLLKFIEAIQTRPPVWLRSRSGKNAPFEKALAKREIEFRKHAFLSDAYAVEAGIRAGEIQRETGYLFEIQDLSSQAVGLVCAPASGEKWWDVCAGAGGKALQLADIAQGNCLVTATDRRPAPIKELRLRAKHAQIACIRPKVVDVVAKPKSDEKFDGVLVDAPCSGLGTWSRHPDARWRTSPEQIKSHAIYQRRILSRAAENVRAGGSLVYSVCTLTTAETIETVAGFLEDHPAFSLQSFPDPLTGNATEGTACIWPWEGPSGGMFIARFTHGG
ncbi:MAG: RsmB/NOP family class I SAM-dependent RNA methyltransferase [Verrucomicrobia bacterium]|nr:RsmB/NOP family class I SAM-dependent RNA methyltransferase [Verrucomicrobiota bacterium]